MTVYSKEIFDLLDQVAKGNDPVNTLTAIRRIVVEKELAARYPDQTNKNSLRAQADTFWADEEMREDFVNQVEHYAAQPEIQELFRTCNAGEQDPQTMFCVKMERDIDSNLKIFLYDWLNENLPV